jgi:hypothetical protein
VGVMRMDSLNRKDQQGLGYQDAYSEGSEDGSDLEVTEEDVANAAAAASRWVGQCPVCRGTCGALRQGLGAWAADGASALGGLRSLHHHSSSSVGAVSQGQVQQQSESRSQGCQSEGGSRTWASVFHPSRVEVGNVYATGSCSILCIYKHATLWISAVVDAGL